MSSRAPVVIVTLCRFDHFRRCVESLAQNSQARETDLIVSLDHPPAEKHRAGHDEIASYVPRIAGFKSVELIERERNLGAIGNALDSMDLAFGRADRLIFTEDDNEFAPNFLSFVNACLDRYGEDPSVFAVSGYNYPITVPDGFAGDHYLWPGFSAWGCGLWKQKWQSVEFSNERVRRQLFQPSTISRLKVLRLLTIANALNSLRSDAVHVDASVELHMRASGQYCVFPTRTKVRNHGHDGSGEHCGTSDVFKSQELDTSGNETLGRCSLDESLEIWSALKDWLDIKPRTKIRYAFEYAMAYLTAGA